MLWCWMDLIANEILYIAQPVGAPWIGTMALEKRSKNQVLIFSPLDAPCYHNVTHSSDELGGLSLPSCTAHRVWVICREGERVSRMP